MAPSLLSEAELSFPSHLFYTTLWRYCNNFFIFKILQHSFTLQAPWTRKCLKCLPLFQMCVGKIVPATTSDSSKHCSLRITLYLLFVITRWWWLHPHLSNSRGLVYVASHRILCPFLCLCTRKSCSTIIFAYTFILIKTALNKEMWTPLLLKRRCTGLHSTWLYQLFRPLNQE